jgi:polyisoprenoid-binding protein YceI
MRGHRGQSLHSLIVLIALFASYVAQAQNGPCVVPGRGYFRIHVGTGGLFGAFAHDHLIEAQKVEGCAVIDAKDLMHSSIKLTFPAASIRVMDPKESEKDRATVQQTMEKDILGVSEFPRIVFQSTSLESGGGANQLKVHGNLTIRDKTQPVVIPLTFKRLSDGTYQADGKYNFKQSSFGIKPIQLGGGTIKVKDELESEFQLFLK